MYERVDERHAFPRSFQHNTKQVEAVPNVSHTSYLWEISRYEGETRDQRYKCTHRASALVTLAWLLLFEMLSTFGR